MPFASLRGQDIHFEDSGGPGLPLVLGVDRFLDLCRTTLNVTGDLAVATCVAAGEPDDLPHDEPTSAPGNAG